MILSPDDWEVIRLSLKVAIVGVVATLPIAFALAYALARGFRGGYSSTRSCISRWYCRRWSRGGSC
jgi:ABC-type molybdate transport system permease subunit